VDTRDELIEAFTAATTFALREMVGVEAVVRESRPAPGASLSAVIRLTTAGGEGRLVLSCSESTAAALAARVLAQAVNAVPPEMVRDCLGEVANVVAGQAKVLLVGHPAHFTLSTPTVRAGEAGELAAGTWTIPFASDVGEVTVHLLLPV
jgi:chemotaxis protein CheX